MMHAFHGQRQAHHSATQKWHAQRRYHSESQRAPSLTASSLLLYRDYCYTSCTEAALRMRLWDPTCLRPKTSQSGKEAKV